MLFQTDDAESSIHIDFVPMADVLFNLLIFFLLATTIAQVEREINVALPTSGHAAPITQELRELIINVDKDGKVTVAGRTTTLPELRDQIATAVKNNPRQKVSVRGDRSTAYANIAAVLDTCKSAGVSEPYLDTIPIGTAMTPAGTTGG
jgi:biopolymer transport protein ExbD